MTDRRYAVGDPTAFLRATHTTNLAQGLGFRAMKSVRSSLRVGSAFEMAPSVPASIFEGDAEAAERVHQFYSLLSAFSSECLVPRAPRFSSASSLFHSMPLRAFAPQGS